MPLPTILTPKHVSTESYRTSVPLVQAFLTGVHTLFRFIPAIILQEEPHY